MLSGQGCRTVIGGCRAEVELSLAGENCSTGVETCYTITSFATILVRNRTLLNINLSYEQPAFTGLSLGMVFNICLFLRTYNSQ